MEREAKNRRMSANAQAARAQIERLLASATFRNVPQLRKLLRGLALYAGERRGDELTEKVIAIDILGKGDGYLKRQKRDPVVSVEKGRLVRKLNEYYSGEGREDAIVVSLPKRGFALEFQLRAFESSPGWHLVQKARHLWSTRRPQAIREAMALLREALQMDTTLAPAHAALADCYSHLALWGVRPADVLPRAREHALQALEIDEEAWEAHAALAAVHMSNWEWAEAEREFGLALALDFRRAVLYPWYPALLTVLGRIDEGLEIARSLCLEDPVALEPKQMYALLLVADGQDSRGLEIYRELVQLHPWFHVPYFYLAWIPLSQGKCDEALQAALRLLEVTSSPYAHATLGMCYGFAGLKREAVEVLEQLRRRSADEYIQAGAVEMVHIGLGQIEEALDQFEIGLAGHEPYSMWFTKWPFDRFLATHPRANQILRKMNM